MARDILYLVEERTSPRGRWSHWASAYVSASKAKADIENRARHEGLGTLRWAQDARGDLTGHLAEDDRITRSFKIVPLGMYREKGITLGTISSWLLNKGVAILAMIEAAVIGLLVIAAGPRVLVDAKQFFGPGRWQPTAAEWSAVGETTMRTGPNGLLQLTTPPGYMRWFGAYLASPRLCDYRLTLDARTSAEQATTYGYGIAPGATVEAGIPNGYGVQYDHAFGGIRYPDYPYDRADNQSGYIDADTTFPDGSPITIDNKWHHWLFIVQRTTANVYMDNHEVRPLQLADVCGGGIYLRVWDGRADFRNVRIAKP